MTRQERELIVMSLKSRADMLKIVKQYEGAVWFKVGEVEKTIDELTTLAHRIESGQWDEDIKTVVSHVVERHNSDVEEYATTSNPPIEAALRLMEFFR